MTVIISSNRWGVSTVCKHIIPQEALAGACIGICVEEALDDWVVISGLQVIEAGLRVVVVPAIAQGVDVREAAGGGEDVAPGVVGILCHRCVLAVQKLDHVALGVQHVVIGVVARLRLVVVPPHQEGMAGFVIDEIQRVLEYGIFSRVAVQPVDGFSHDPAVLGHVLMPQAVGDLHAADAGHIVRIGIQVAALGYAAEPAALGPGEVGIIRPVVPVEGVGRVGIGNRASYAVHGDPGELVGPCAVAIGVTDAVLSADDAAKVARGVDGIIDCRGGCGRRGGSGIGVPGLLRKLVQIVVGASNLPWQGEVARSAGGVADRFAAVSFTGVRPTLPLLRVPAGRSSSPLQERFLSSGAQRRRGS